METIYTVDLENFRGWLELFNAEEIVGQSIAEGSCPMKNYLSTIDSQVKCVWEYIYFQDGSYSKLDEKAFTIVQAIDETALEWLDKEGGIIGSERDMTAEEVLQILDGLYPGLVKGKEVVHA